VQERFGPNSAVWKMLIAASCRCALTDFFILFVLKERLAVKDYNFRQLDNLLLPPYCRFLLWLSIQDDTFFDQTNNHGAKAAVADGAEKKKIPSIVKKDTLWQTLISDLGLTYEQDEKLKSLYKYDCARAGTMSVLMMEKLTLSMLRVVRSGDSKTSKSERRRVALAVVRCQPPRFNT
jgi:hypothetical protein